MGNKIAENVYKTFTPMGENRKILMRKSLSRKKIDTLMEMVAIAESGTEFFPVPVSGGDTRFHAWARRLKGDLKIAELYVELGRPVPTSSAQAVKSAWNVVRQFETLVDQLLDGEEDPQ